LEFRKTNFPRAKLKRKAPDPHLHQQEKYGKFRQDVAKWGGKKKGKSFYPEPWTRKGGPEGNLGG